MTGMFDAMRRFYNLFPYPSRPLFAFPDIRASLFAHLGLWRLAAVGRADLVRQVWDNRDRPSQLPANANLEALDRALAESRRPRILLAGCGTDEPLLFASLHPDAHITAIDLSSRSLSLARRRVGFARRLAQSGLFPVAKRAARAEIDFVTAEVVAWLEAHPDSRFEYIQCFGVLHHQPDAHTMFRSLARALTPNGILRVMIYSCKGRRLERRIQSKHRSLWHGTETASATATDKAVRRAVHREWWNQALQKFNPAGSAMARRFRYLGGRRVNVADALFHPSDPGLPLGNVAEWIASAGFQVLFCSAKEHELGWRVGLGHPDAQKMLNRIAKADDQDQLVSNLTLVLRKPSA